MQSNSRSHWILSDRTRIYKKNSASDLRKYNDTNKSLKDIEKNFDHIVKISSDKFWSIECDIVIPAALELQLTDHVAKLLKCRLVAEGANGATTVYADKILLNKNIEVIPDVLCNSAGVVVSYFEWIQNRTNDYWDVKTVENKLKKLVDETCKRLFDLKTNQNNSINNRTLAYVMALNTLYKYYKIKI